MIDKLKFNQELNKEDIKELKNLLYGKEEIDYFEIKKEYSSELNKFQIDIFYSLIGLDRESIDKGFSKFLDKQKFNSDQIKLIEMIIKNGVFSKKDFYNTSKDILVYPIYEIFEKDALKNIVQIIDKINKNADLQ